ncbi:unnamed protein product [Victoria cruziana]
MRPLRGLRMRTGGNGRKSSPEKTIQPEEFRGFRPCTLHQKALLIEKLFLQRNTLGIASGWPKCGDDLVGGNHRKIWYGSHDRCWVTTQSSLKPPSAFCCRRTTAARRI